MVVNVFKCFLLKNSNQCLLFLYFYPKINVSTIVPTAAPIIIQVEITSTTLAYSWSDLRCPDRNGKISYEIALLKDTTLQYYSIIQLTRFTFGDLTPFTRYNFTVRATTRVGEGPRSNSIHSETSKDGTTVFSLTLETHFALIKK